MRGGNSQPKAFGDLLLAGFGQEQVQHPAFVWGERVEATRVVRRMGRDRPRLPQRGHVPCHANAQLVRRVPLGRPRQVDVRTIPVPIAILEAHALVAGQDPAGLAQRLLPVCRHHQFEHELADQIGLPVAEDFLAHRVGVADLAGLVDQEDGVGEAVGQRNRAILLEKYRHRVGGRRRCGNATAVRGSNRSSSVAGVRRGRSGQ
ncbi:hypothetical protein D3C87_1195550 [compost metagenome]